MVDVTITNVESVAHAGISINALTAIVGESNNGKTALFNALNILTYNVQGRSYIRKVDGEEVKSGCNVKVDFKDGVVVEFNKAAAPVYKLTVGDRTEVYDKAGRGPTPEFVANALNMQPLFIDNNSYNLNFLVQLTTPLLRQITDFQMYKIAVKSFDGEKIQEAIALANSDLKSIKEKMKQEEITIDVHKKNRLSIIDRQDIYAPIASLEAEFRFYEAACNKQPVLTGFANQLIQLNESMAKTDRMLLALAAVDGVVQDTIQVQQGMKDLQLIQGIYEQYVGIDAQLARIDNELALLSLIDMKEYDYYISSSSRLQELVFFQNRINDLEQEGLHIAEHLQALTGLGEVTAEVEAQSTAYKNVPLLKELNGQVVRLHNTQIQVDTQLAILDDSYNVGVEAYNKNKSGLAGCSAALPRIQDLNNRITTIDSDVAELTELAADLQHRLDNGLCPTCGAAPNKCND